MDFKTIEKIVTQIRGSLFKNSNSYSIGMLKSHFKGSGLQFKEHQVYNHGDDVRFIDWNLSAKMNSPFIKTFEEERNVEIVVVLDASATMLSGYKGKSKLLAGIELCCLLFHLAKQTKDFIHVLVVSDKIINIEKNSGEKGIVNLICQLEKNQLLQTNGNTNISYRHKETVSSQDKLKSIMKHISKKREVVIFSDFNEFIDIKALDRIFYSRRVHCFKLVTPLDEVTKVPFSILAKDSIKSRAKTGRVKVKKKMEEDRLGPKIKKLKIHERYLEDFVKEML
jgi:uncharacterized protein (DUF58 family)